MLFHVTQTHTPELCPLNDEKPLALFQANEHVNIVGMYANPLAHTLYFILETDSFEELQNFFGDGMTKSVVNIQPVMEMKSE